MLKSDQNAVMKVCWDGKCSCGLIFSYLRYRAPKIQDGR